MLPNPTRTLPTVHLIDDAPNDILILQRLCKSAGLAVETYDSPQSFLRNVGRDSQGCIVADLIMPEMTGLQLHEELQKSKLGMPIIIITDHADAQTCRTALHNGVFDFVEKSFNPHDLLVVIRSAIERDIELNDQRSLRYIVTEQLQNLSKREREVMQLLANGLTLKDVGTELQISVQTASKHRSRLFEKLNVQNEVELLRLLILIDPALELKDPVAA